MPVRFVVKNGGALLRRAEKDFLLRKDTKYEEAFDTTINKMKALQ